MTRRRRRLVKASDPVTAYARAMVEGRIVAGRMAILAGRRHLADLKRQRTRGFRCYWDRAAADHLIEFFPRNLLLESGDAFELTPWAKFALGCFFGWRRISDGGRRFKFFYGCTGKGTGKTPMLAGVGMYGLRYDREAAAEIYGAAFDKSQSYIMLRDAIRMAETSPRRREMRLTIGKHNIGFEEAHSFFRNTSSEDRSKSGPRPHFVLIDELHEHRDGRVVTKLKAGFKRRVQPAMFLMTNAGSNRTSVCWEYHEHSMKVLEGVIRDEEFFAFLCQLDPCEKCRVDGYWQPNPNCKDCDNWKDQAVWPKANPSLEQGLPTRSYLQTEVDSTAIASNLNSVMRLSFGIWTSSRKVWIPTDRWAACEHAPASTANPDYRPCAGGGDLSGTLDLSSVVIALRFDDAPSSAPAEVVTIDGMDEAGAPTKMTVTLNFSVELIPLFWIPEATLIERVTKERIPYDQWKLDGHLEATPGAVIDHQRIYDQIIWARKHFHMQRFGMDQHNATMMFVKLRDEGKFGDDVVAVGQGKKLSEAFKLMEILIASKRLRHSGHPVLAWNMSNAEPQKDRIGALWIEKPSDNLRIDGAVGAAMAIQQLMILPTRRRGSTYATGKRLRTF